MHSYIWASLLRIFPLGPGSCLYVLCLMAFPYSPDPEPPGHSTFSAQYKSFSALSKSCLPCLPVFSALPPPRNCGSKSYFVLGFPLVSSTSFFLLTSCSSLLEYMLSLSFPPHLYPSSISIALALKIILHLGNVREV